MTLRIVHAKRRKLRRSLCIFCEGAPGRRCICVIKAISAYLAKHFLHICDRVSGCLSEWSLRGFWTFHFGKISENHEGISVHLLIYFLYVFVSMVSRCLVKCTLSHADCTHLLQWFLSILRMDLFVSSHVIAGCVGTCSIHIL